MGAEIETTPMLAAPGSERPPSSVRWRTKATKTRSSFRRLTLAPHPIPMPTPLPTRSSILPNRASEATRQGVERESSAFRAFSSACRPSLWWSASSWAFISCSCECVGREIIAGRIAYGDVCLTGLPHKAATALDDMSAFYFPEVDPVLKGTLSHEDFVWVA